MVFLCTWWGKSRPMFAPECAVRLHIQVKEYSRCLRESRNLLEMNGKLRLIMFRTKADLLATCWWWKEQNALPNQKPRILCCSILWIWAFSTVHNCWARASPDDILTHLLFLIGRLLLMGHIIRCCLCYCSFDTPDGDIIGGHSNVP